MCEERQGKCTEEVLGEVLSEKFGLIEASPAETKRVKWHGAKIRRERETCVTDTFGEELSERESEFLDEAILVGMNGGGKECLLIV
jgi:hypothetical protein